MNEKAKAWRKTLKRIEEASTQDCECSVCKAVRRAHLEATRELMAEADRRGFTAALSEAPTSSAQRVAELLPNSVLEGDDDDNPRRGGKVVKEDMFGNKYLDWP